MALNLSTSAQVILDRLKADVAVAIPGTSPGLRNSFLLGILTGLANRFFDLILDLIDVLKEALPNTAVVKLEDWAATKGVVRISGAKSSGFIEVTAVSGVGSIAKDLFWSAVDGREYISTSATAVVSTAKGIDSIIDDGGGEATVKFDSDHGYAGGEDIVITGCVVETVYNATFLNIEIVDLDEVKIFGHGSTGDETAGSPAIATTFAASVPVDSTEIGIDTELVAGGAVTITVPIPDVADVAVSILGLAGGADQETLEAFRDRYLEEVRNPIAHFNVSDITRVAKTIAGVTRVFVQENTPDIGATTVYFTRDEDLDLIPSGAEVVAVDTVLQAIRPANMQEADFDVLAPTPLVVNWIFSALSPNTATMQTAIEENLKQFFAEETSVGVDIQEDGIRSAIFTTIDPDTGDKVVSFTYTTPASGDITIASGEIGKIGTFVWP